MDLVRLISGNFLQKNSNQKSHVSFGVSQKDDAEACGDRCLANINVKPEANHNSDEVDRTGAANAPIGINLERCAYG